MNMQSFRVEPRISYMEIIKIACGCHCKHKHVTIRLRTEESDMPATSDVHYDQKESVHGKVEEVLSIDATGPLGKHVVIIRYYDDNLYHNVITGRSVTGVFNFVKKSL